MANTIDVLEGQTGQIKIAATYENKPVNEKVTLDSAKSDFKGLLTPGELTNGTLSYTAKTPGVGTCKLVFNYTGTPAKQGEGESFATRTIDVSIKELKLTYEIGDDKFGWADAAEYNTSFKLFANGVEVPIDDPDVEYERYSKLKMIYIYDFTQGLTIDLEEIPDFDYTEGRDPFVDHLIIRYKGKTLEVPITFISLKVIKGTEKPWRGDKIYGFTYDFPFDLLYSDGSDPTADIISIQASPNEWLTVDPVTNKTTITKDIFHDGVETTQNWTVTAKQHDYEFKQLFRITFWIARGFSYPMYPNKIEGMVGDTGVLDYRFNYHKEPDASRIEIDLSTVDTKGAIEFGTPDLSNFGSIKVPYTIKAAGEIRVMVPFYQKETTPRRNLAEFELMITTKPKIEKIVPTRVSPTSNTDPLSSGTATMILKYNTGELVTDATVVTYSTIAHSDVYTNVGSSFRATDAAAGKYSYGWSSGYNSGIGQAKFTVKTKYGEFTFDSPTISNDSQYLEITTDSTWMYRNEKDTKFTASAKQKRTPNGSPVTVTGTLIVSAGYGVKVSTQATGNGPWSFGLSSFKGSPNAVVVTFTVGGASGSVTFYPMD